MTVIVTWDECPGQLATQAAPLPIPRYCHLRDVQTLNRLMGNGNYTWIEFAGAKRPTLVSQTRRYLEP